MPGNAVIVVSFPEPENDMEMAHIIQTLQMTFAGKPQVKLHMGINDVADRVIDIFSPLNEGGDDG